MRRIIGTLGSLFVGVMLTAAGLVLDARTLIYSGVAIFALMAALWLYAWGSSPTSIATQPKPLPFYPEDEPSVGPVTEQQRALLALRRARDSAAIAKAQKGEEGARKAYHELQAALLSVKREFGFGPLKLTSKTGGTVPYSYLMDCYIAYVDRIYPLLRGGHIDEAKKEADTFKWSWGE